MYRETKIKTNNLKKTVEDVIRQLYETGRVLILNRWDQYLKSKRKII